MVTSNFWGSVLFSFIFIIVISFLIFMIIKVFKKIKLERYDKRLTRAKTYAYDYIITNTKEIRKNTKKIVNKRDTYDITEYLFTLIDQVDKSETIEEIENILDDFDTLINAVDYNN